MSPLINKMNPNIANNIINEYAAKKGYPTVEELYNMNHIDFMMKTDFWLTEYLETLPDAGLYYNLANIIINPHTGQKEQTEWGRKMSHIKDVIKFRETTEGKKKYLLDNIPEPVRNKESDIDDMLKTASIKVSAASGNEKQNKEQTQLNIKRMEHIVALEKSISKGGALRAMYDTTLETHKEGIENLITNEEVARLVMKEKRHKKFPALLLSWIIMPLYVILRCFDMFFDGYFTPRIMGSYINDVDPKVGSRHPLLGRLSIPILFGTFLSFMDASENIKLGTEAYVNNGIFITGIVAMPLYALGFAVVKQFLNVPFAWLVEKYGAVAEWASEVFNIANADDYQLGEINMHYDNQEVIGKLIKEREHLIVDLKYAIENDLPYNKCDSFYNDKELSIKALNKEERDTFGK